MEDRSGGKSNYEWEDHLKSNNAVKMDPTEVKPQTYLLVKGTGHNPRNL